MCAPEASKLHTVPVLGDFVLAIDHDRCLADLLRPQNFAQLLPGLCEFVESLAQGRRVIVHSFSNRVSDAFNLCRQTKSPYPSNLEAVRELCEHVSSGFGLAWCARETYILNDAEVASLFPATLQAEYLKLNERATEAFTQRRLLKFDEGAALTAAIQALQNGTELKARVAAKICTVHSGTSSYLFADDKLENLRTACAVTCAASPRALFFWPTQMRLCKMGEWSQTQMWGDKAVSKDVELACRARLLQDDPDDKQAWLRARDYLGVHIIGSSLACIAAKSLGVPRWEDLMEATASHPLLPDVPP